jgi:hypothetical protein
MDAAQVQAVVDAAVAQASAAHQAALAVANAANALAIQQAIAAIPPPVPPAGVAGGAPAAFALTPGLEIRDSLGITRLVKASRSTHMHLRSSWTLLSMEASRHSKCC